MPPRLLNLAAVYVGLLITLAQATAASSIVWPSLQFNFSIKRSSMKVYGQSKFSMFATPIVSANDSSVHYDVFAQFTEGTSHYNYTEVSGNAYLSSTSTDDTSTAPFVECFTPESAEIPSINSIISAINEASPVSGASDSGGNIIECSTGNLFKVSVHGIAFALCASSTGFTIHGIDVDISVTYLENDVSIEEPATSTDTHRKCITTSPSSIVTVMSKPLLTGAPVVSVDKRNLEAELDFSLGNSCSCKSKPRPCVFVHGLGIKKELARNRDRFYYWGDLDDHAPCCSSMKYTYLNTSGNPWTSDTLQQKVCNRVLAVSTTSLNSTISGTIVVTHSMGNLMLAGAIATGKCNFDSSSTWVGLAGPMKGSMCSDFIQDSCAGKTTEVLETVAEVTGKCPPTIGLKSLPYQGGKYSSTWLDEAYEAAQEAYRANVYAVMCGERNVGLVSLYQSVFWMLGKTVPHKSKKNDGMVEFDSCAAGFSQAKFGNTYRDRFYRTKLNHFDMEFVSGDAMFDEAKMPVKWFECLL